MGVLAGTLWEQQWSALCTGSADLTQGQQVPAVPHSAAQHTTPGIEIYYHIHYHTVTNSTIQYCTVTYSTIHYHTVPYSTIQYHTVTNNLLQLYSHSVTLVYSDTL